jgi:5-methylcytosine-specific restriction endonuclease McrA
MPFKPKLVGKCQFCGRPFEAKRISKRFCSRSCVARIYSATHKPGEFRKAYSAAYRATHAEELRQSDASYRENHREELAAKSRAYSAAHAEEISGRWRAHYATHAEEIRRTAANYRETHAEERRSARHRRRARLMGGEREAFALQEIYARDEWTCQLCREPVDPSLGYPSPMMRSLDHVVRLADGGGHTRANVRLTHLVCNLRRTTRGGSRG